jgi:uncharacterized repeat protein (TIGR01451 family)
MDRTMKSRVDERSQGYDAPAGRSAWVRRVIVGGLGTAGATVALAAFAAGAFANAPNPTGATATVSDPNAQGQVTVTVSGTWSWEAPASPTPQTDCDGRYGVGWNVDWWGINTAGNAIPGLSYPAVASSGNTILTNGAGQPTMTTDSTASPVTTLVAKSGTVFHASKTLNGFQTPLCTNGHPVGSFSTTATYPNAAAVPSKICVNFYDLHGSPGKPKLDDFFSTANDNSIRTNSFDPATVGGNCFVTVPQHPSIGVDKTNNADGVGGFSDSETAPALSTNVPFKVVISNTSTVAVTIDSVKDAVPTGSNAGNVACLDGNNQNVVGKQLNPKGSAGDSVTCFFTINNYLASNGIAVDGQLEDDVIVAVHSSNGNQGSGHDTSTVNAPAGQSNVTVVKDGPPTGDLDGNGTYTITATNNGNKTSVAQDITDTLPDGEQFVAAGSSNACSATNATTVTCSLGALAPGGKQTFTVVIKYTKTGDLKDCATVAGQPVPSCVTTKVDEPKVTVKKTGPATGDLNGNGTYKIVATNNGGADSKATTFTDTLPTGETFVSFTGPANMNCSAAGQVVTCDLGPLAKNGGSATYNITVKYTKSGDLEDCATIAGQPVPSCVTTHVGEPKVTVKKTGPAKGDLDGNGTYTIVATNNGDGPSDATTFTDTLPSGETFVSFTGPANMNCSAAGQVVTCDLGPLAKNGGSATYTVTVKYTKSGDLQDCATIAGQPVPSCVTTHVGEPNVTVKKTGPAIGLLNDTGTYQIVATNNGDGPSKATTFTDTLPDGESFVAAGSSNACSAVGQLVTCNLTALDAKGGLHDSASFTIVVKYSKTGNLTDCATINGQPVPSCVTTTVQQPKLQVIKTGPATGTLNGNGTYQIVAVNNGDAASTATTFTDTLPAGESFVSSTGPGNCSANGQVVTCQLGPLAANGGSATYTVTVTYTKTGNLTDCATIGGQPVPSCVTTHIPGPPVLTVVKTNDADGDGVFHDSETAANPGDAVTFKVVITNNSTEPIALDTIKDAFSATELAECPNLISVVLDSGDSVSCTFTVDNYAPAAGSSLTDTVTVTGHQVPGGTPVTGSDTSVVKTRNPQTPGPDLAIVKNADQEKVKSGDTLTYTLTVSNVGDGPTTGSVLVTDTVPDGLDLVSVDGGALWDCSADDGVHIVCSYEGGVLNPGDVAPVITVITTVNDDAVGSVINTGVVSTPGDTNPLNDRSTVKTPVTKVLPEKIVKPETPEVLPFTGDRTGQMLPVGLLAVMVGLLLLAVARRRRTN